jgi:hypothetical protein
LTDTWLEEHEDRVLAAIRHAASDAIESGAASLEVITGETCGVAGDDALVIALRPQNPKAAEIVVEVHDESTWYLFAGAGPSYEFYPGMPEERYAHLQELVSAVVMGRYEHGREERKRRSLLRPWMESAVPAWFATFHTSRGAITTTHVGQEPPRGAEFTCFEPYRKCCRE